MGKPIGSRVAARSGVGFLMLVLLLAPAALAKDATPRVLLLFSHDRLLPANAELEEGFREGIGRHRDEVEIFAEFLDVVRFPERSHAESMTRYLRERYAGQPPDVVVAIGPQSIGFLAGHREQLFPGTPGVIAGFTNRDLIAAEPITEVAGRPMVWTIEPILDEIPKCRSDIRRLHLIAGAAPFDQQRLQDALKVCEATDSGLAVTTSVGEELSSLHDAVARLPRNTLVVYLSYFLTPGGATTVPREVGSELAASASVPVIGLFDTYFGDGITGVCAASFRDEGIAAADLVSRILAGEAPDSIGILPPAEPRFVFDARQLKRWNWDPDVLPAGSIVRHRTPGLWEQHRGAVLGSLAVLLVQSSLIGGLVVTKRRQTRMAQALRRSEARFAGIFAGSPSAVAIVRQSDGRTVEVNPAWESTTGIPRADSIGRTPLELGFVIEGDSEQRFTEFLKSGKPLRNYEQAFRAPDHRMLTLSLATELVELHGEPCYVVMAEDVTGVREATEARRQLSRASRLAQLGEMTAAISHEVNQPLAAILSNTEAAEMLMAQDAPPIDEVRQILSDIRRDDLRASEVIQRVRALVTRKETHFEPIAIGDLLRHSVELIAHEVKRRGVAVEFDIVPGLPPVTGDRGQLEQAFLNLIFNAMEAMAETPVARRQITVSAVVESADRLRITVGDRGTGIDDGNLGKIFDSFFSTKEGGMGLGLALVHSIAELHGGRIGAENNASGGADFHLTLPLQRS
ncbi:ATP-binding protein [Haloferula sp. A504]|uniref:ATP-binding protein n=1 Tax=Haloferula sp. A504 TaxID=3373601 RepID=UPI0031BBDA84|nr:ATP-binding protein [Verrucomicrobiaceae bacterium E54]